MERLFQTLQSRLPVELRLKGITTIKEANIFLNSYIKEYNAKFALPINHNKSVFVMHPDYEIINQTSSILSPHTKIDEVKEMIILVTHNPKIPSTIDRIIKL